MSKNNPDIIFLLDGLTNKIGISGELLLSEKLLESDIKSQWYDYVPVSTPIGEVETIEVFPFFWGLNPEFNPGRAGLESILDGKDISKNTFFVTVRTLNAKLLIKELNQLGIDSRVSKYSKNGNTVIICSDLDKETTLLNYFELNKSNLIKISHIKKLSNGWYDELKKLPSRSPFSLIGYCHGGLESALELCGLQILEENRGMVPFDSLNGYSSKEIEETYLERIRYCIENDQIPVVYLKHFAFNARKGFRKELAADKIAKIVFNIVEEIKKTKNFNFGMIISDHNSEVGIDETLSGMTKIGLIGENFQIMEDYNNGSDQIELIKFLKEKGLGV